ncbi:MAG: hypothetical protein CEN88_48 [Candidatus Berkelbacteria bacterium Licking1014_2]|uniref:Transposase IS200-like domain-containing protein n=1 Tax=Candidatus Berkelbacteria bacterium Licking1014_2 TaxID=2017146 RepID=A0A554LX07_9BACT|nr:MAG: hypothetical protein CEN88_48 [Candidatus Berkelbacteria bacterium Licking1014_2]
MERKVKLVTGEIYHVFNRSIADFTIFNYKEEFKRIKNLLQYYQIDGISPRFSQFINLDKIKTDGFDFCFKSVAEDRSKIIQIIAYCLMPTHLHLILKQLVENGISIFMGDVLNSYTKYFNTKHKRKGPLWESKFKNVLVDDDEQLLHLTRYIHLNPATAFLVNRPQEWEFSSYTEYLGKNDKYNNNICQFEEFFDIKPDSYKEFVEDRIAYQREIEKIKHLLIDN